MKKVTVGIDVSKDKLDYCIINDEAFTVEKSGIIENNSKAISKWLDGLDHQNIVVSLEHTGHYGAALSWVLAEKGICFYMLNPLELKRSMGIQRGKSDDVDAYRIACFTIRHKDMLVPYELPTVEITKLKALMTARERYVKISVQIKNSLAANEILSKTIDMKELIREEKRQLKSTDKAIKKIEEEMMKIITSTETLKKSYDKVLKVIGVGPITTIKCIIETNNFTKFSNARKFSCYCGLAPFPYQSGSSIKGRSRTHPLRNKSLKAILFKAAGSAIQHDPQLKTYYHRKLKEGKNKLGVLNAVANKLVLRIFAVVNREEPFVKMAV